MDTSVKLRIGYLRWAKLTRRKSLILGTPSNVLKSQVSARRSLQYTGMSDAFDGASFPLELNIFEAKEESTMMLRRPSTSPPPAYVENDANHSDTIVLTSRFPGMMGLPSFERVGMAASGIDNVCIFVLSSFRDFRINVRS